MVSLVSYLVGANNRSRLAAAVRSSGSAVAAAWHGMAYDDLPVQEPSPHAFPSQPEERVWNLLGGRMIAVKSRTVRDFWVGGENATTSRSIIGERSISGICWWRGKVRYGQYCQYSTE